MKWAEVSIQAAEEETDLVASCFYDVGATGVVIEDSETESGLVSKDELARMILEKAAELCKK